MPGNHFYLDKNAFSIFAFLGIGRKLVSQQSEMRFLCVASAAHFLFLRRNDMPDYKAMYLSLFNSVTDAIEILTEAQKKAEETYINSAENENAVEEDVIK